ncbi:hypothetical protein M434DRAFT_388607 [Hypoxylon sp. CO27-5]|nr:hypothetical protein M434DRAFT_388607 [Hypoxylon sp. CO27-5]
MSSEAQETLPTSPRGLITEMTTTTTMGPSASEDCNDFQSKWCSCVTCEPTSSENTVGCCTRVIDNYSLRLSSYDCVESGPTYTTLSDCDGSIRPVRMITPSATMTEKATYIPETPESPASIVSASVACFLLLAAVIISAVWLLKRRKQRRNIPYLSTSNQMSTTSHSPKLISHPSMAKSLGWMCIAAFLIGILFEIATLTFLSLFWGPGIREESNMIHTWILENDVAKVVSVSSYILRTSISAHSTAAITMLAAIALEKFTSRIKEVPELLINGTGHVSHYDMVLSLLPKLVRSSPSRHLLFISALSLAALLSALQLSSTILLSDIDLKYTLNESATMQVPVTYTYSRLVTLRDGASNHYQEYPPKAFASFAEQGSYIDEPLQNIGFDFTGNLSRAFLPFSSNSDRQSLGTYSGYTTVLDVGTLCVAPPLASFEVSTLTVVGDVAATRMVGSVDWTKLDANVTYGDLLQYYDITQGKLSNSTFEIVTELPDLSLPSEPEWPTYMFWLDPNGGDVGVSERRLFFSQSQIPLATPRTEPTVLAALAKDLDLSQLLFWLGIAPQVQSFEARGILDLEAISPWKRTEGLGIYEPREPDLAIWAYREEKYFQICASCGSISPLHYIYAGVIQEVLQTTGHPALAAQAFVTLIYQSLYYDQLSTFDIYAEANTTSWVRVSMPVQWTGFIVVCALTAAHTLLVLGILIAFLMSTKYIKLNDPWMIFAYASSGELAEIIEEAKRLKATDHVKMIEKQGLDIEMVGLGPDESDQNIGIRKRSQRVQSSDVKNSADTTEQTAVEGVAEEHTVEASNIEEIVTEAPEELDKELTTTGTNIQVARRD